MAIIPFPASGSDNGNNELHPSGGGPYDGDMERRVASLEMDVRAIKNTLSDIRAQLATLPTKADLDAFRKEVNLMAVDVGTVKGRVSALPTLSSLSTLAVIITAAGSAILFLYHTAIKHGWW